MRLNRYLSLCGLGSRRGCEEIVLQGRVTINGQVVKTLATTVSDRDEVVADARPVRPAQGVVLALHKPKGFLCTRSDTHERTTIYALLPPKYQNLHHVGRLDKESEGLLLMTNRGDLSHRLSHPSQGVEKEYEVTIDTPFAADNLARLIAGVHTEEGLARAERAWMVTPRRLHMVLKQGLKRQIRLMLFALGHEVETLTRIRIGQLKLYGLPKGGWKELTEAEIQRFFSKSAESPKRALQSKPSDRDQAELAEDSEVIRPRIRPPQRTAPPAAKRGTRDAKPRERSSKPVGSKTFRGAGGDKSAGKPFRSSSNSDKPTGKPFRSASTGDKPRGKAFPKSSSPSSSKPSARPSGPRKSPDAGGGGPRKSGPRPGGRR